MICDMVIVYGKQSVNVRNQIGDDLLLFILSITQCSSFSAVLNINLLRRFLARIQYCSPSQFRLNRTVRRWWELSIDRRRYAEAGNHR